MRLSVCIPYRARLHNLALAFDALAAQTLPRDGFEVVVGAMEYSPDLIQLCARFEDRLDIVTVCSSRDFHIPHARNLAMRAATGDVVVQMDADTLLDAHALEYLYQRHFAFGQQVCAVGQVVGYGNNEDGTVEHVEHRSFTDHAKVLAAMAAGPDWPADVRFQVPHHIPWAFTWTGLIAVPRAAVHTHALWFDETFRGWGVDDLEWGFRVSRIGLPVRLCPEVFALHLPHVRDQTGNERTESRNYERFLAKWPCRDVELAKTIGDTRANDRWPGYLAELARAGGADTLGVAVGTSGGRPAVWFGVPLDEAGRPVEARPLTGSDTSAVEIWPLTGLSLPATDGQFANAWVWPAVTRLAVEYREVVLAEAARVAAQVVVEPAPTEPTSA